MVVNARTKSLAHHLQSLEMVGDHLVPVQEPLIGWRTRPRVGAEVDGDAGAAGSAAGGGVEDAAVDMGGLAAWKAGARPRAMGWRCGGGAAGEAEGRHRGRRPGLGVPRGGSWSRGPVMRGAAAGEAEGRHEVREVEALSREAGGVG